jgi:hypothetical protein
MTNFAPPPPSNLKESLEVLTPLFENRYGRRADMPSVRDLLEGFADYVRAQTPSTETSLAKESPDAFVWRYRDEAQGREIRQPLPRALLKGLGAVVTTLANPLSAVGRNPAPRPFADVDEFLSFVCGHVVKNESQENRRNTRYREGTRRAYGLRLPTALKAYLEMLRPVTRNPYTGQTFSSLSQLMVFCVHAFSMVEPWRIDDGPSIWRENRASNRPSGSEEKHEGSVAGQSVKFPRIEGMTQIQVRLDQVYYQELLKYVETLNPVVSHSAYQLTMSGYWISALAWAVYSIDWAADPLTVKSLEHDGPPTKIAWRNRAPESLL